jgi:hypothetical protein
LQPRYLPDLVHFETRILRLRPVKRLLADPALRITSATGTPARACFNTPLDCSTLKRFFFISRFLHLLRLGCGRRLPFQLVEN